LVQPDRYAQSLDKIRAAADAAGRSMAGFTAAHLAFITIGRDWEAAKRTWVRVLSNRYAQDFEPLVKRYGVIGTPEQCSEQLERFPDLLHGSVLLRFRKTPSRHSFHRVGRLRVVKKVAQHFANRICLVLRSRQEPHSSRRCGC